MERVNLTEAMQIVARLTMDELKEITEMARKKTAARSDTVCNIEGGEEHATDECA